MTSRALEAGEAALVRQVRAEVAEALSHQGRSGPGDWDSAPGRTDPALDGDRAGWADHEQRAAAWALISLTLQRHVRQALDAGRPALSAPAEDRIARAVYDDLIGVGGFTPLLADPGIENIDANGCDEVWVRYADGRRERAAPVASSDKELVELIRTIAARTGEQERRFDRGVPRLSVQLPDGSRMFAVMAVSRRPAVSIRRHRFPKVTLADLQRLGTLDAGLRDFLTALVLAKKNILIVGGTNAGKTTMLRALAAAIPPHERLVTIEDAYELGLDTDTIGHPDVVALQAREPNVEGEGEVTQSELVRWALRMSPDRVMVGEIRGAEVIAMFNAMSQGNDGSMATVHALDSAIAFTRLANYAIQAPERLPIEATNLLIANAVHFVVYLGTAHRTDHDGPRGDQRAGQRDGQLVRVVSSIREVVGADGLQLVTNEVFRPGPDGRALPAAAVQSATADALLAVGYDSAALAHSGRWWPQ